MKIILIGPVYPYKGGISHYTGLLYQALIKRGFQVSLHSFKFQYPEILYKKEQKDERTPQFKIDNAKYSIHTMNPFNWFNVSRIIKREMPDLIIIQWWHPYFAPCYWALCKMLRRYKILFVCHNVFPHERFPLDKILTKKVLKQGDYYITQSYTDAKDLLTIKADAVYGVTPHPTYNIFKMKGLSRQEARKILQIKEESKVLLFFGFIRVYKGLKYLLSAMPEIIRDVSNVELWIVGDFGSGREEYFEQITKLGISSKVKIVEGYIADTDVEQYFAASDLVVLPYVSATQSGIVQIAFGFEKPIIVTNVGGLPDVVKDGKTGYVVSPGSPDELAGAVKDFFGNNRSDYFRQNIKKEEKKFSWDTFVDKLCEVLEEDNQNHEKEG